MIHNLQALRALAAWMVVAHHMRGSLAEVWAPMGETLVFASGVDIFFVLSGYVMVASTKDRPPSALTFWRRRLTRIAPLYWLVTTLILLALLVGLKPVGVAAWDWRDVAASYMFLGAERADGYPGPLLGVGWTLAYEAFFYAMFGLALMLRARAAVVSGAAILTCVLIGAFAAPSSFPAQFYTAPILLEFAFGAGLAHFSLNRGGGVLLGAGALGLLAGGAWLGMLAPTGDLITPGGAGAHWRTLCFGVPAALVVAGAIALERKGAVCRSRLALDQGDASYALYLLHLPILQVIEKSIGAGAAALLIAPPVLAFAAHYVHQEWERPVLAALRPRSFDLRTYRLAG